MLMKKRESSPDLVWSFGYGSNMPTQCLAWKKVPIVAGRSKGCVLRGYKLFFTDMGGMANIYPSEGDEVYGVAHLMTRETKMRLDQKEGGGVYYGLETVECHPLDGSPAITAEIFCYRGNLPPATGCPTERYRDILLEGAREFQLPESYIKQLEDQPVVANTPKAEWAQLPSSDRVISDAELRKMLDADPERLLLKFFGRVVEPTRSAQNASLYNIFMMRRGADLTPEVGCNYYYPGLTAEEHQLFLQDYLGRRMGLRVVGMAGSPASNV